MNVVGPVPCQGCRRLTWWSGLEWVSRTGIRHHCGWKINRTKGRSEACGERTSVRFGLASHVRACENEQTEYSGSQSSYHAKRPLPGCTPGEGSLASRSTDEMHLADRFWSHVDKSGECWLWTASLGSAGYGQFRVGSRTDGTKRTVYAHRVAYELTVGTIPDGLTLDHLCRNRACVNPEHLEPVSNRENILRGEGPSAVHARKTTCHAGHPFDEANTYENQRGGRECRACRREADRRRDLRCRTTRDVGVVATIEVVAR